MSSQQQIQANRKNAKKSTGPKTPEGKAAASQNALKHGLTATRDVVATESQEDYDAHRQALLEELTPQGPMQSILAERIVSLSWRLRRAGYIQNQAIDVFEERINPDGYRRRRQQEDNEKDPNLILGRVALRDFTNERVIDRLQMYETRIENSLYKTIQKLKTLQKNARPAPSIINIEDPELASGINPTPSLASSCPCASGISGNEVFPQNKPNLLKAKILPTLAPVTNYSQTPPFPQEENKPNILSQVPINRESTSRPHSNPCHPYAPVRRSTQ